MTLGSTSFPSKMSQKTEQVGNSNEVTDHIDFGVAFTVTRDTHFKREPLGSPPTFTHTHSHTLMHWNAIQLLGVAGSCQVLHHEEHDHTGDEHPPRS